MNNTFVLPPLILDGTPVSVRAVCEVAQRQRSLEISSSPEFRARISAVAEFVDELLASGADSVYGVTTGYGDSCTVPIQPHLVAELPRHLYTYHGCGLGRYFSPEETRAILVVRLVSLARGMSGVSVELLQQIELLLHHDILPLIPSEGSVGASGDLTPLSYLAAVLCGERTVWYRGECRDSAEVFTSLGIVGLRLRPKEGLALMNGTAVMTGLACLAWSRAEYFSRLATRITAMNVVAAAGNPHHFDEGLFAVKPHRGQQRVASRLRQDLPDTSASGETVRIQDRYSLRCAPHVIGVLEDALDFSCEWIENELNSANDNPIIDPVQRRVWHGGHFYGGHIAFVMDSIKVAVANVADLLDRQMALLVDARFNHGLPANLSGAQGERACINHGLKALQISVSAWTAEALKQCVPVSIFSRSTECHNQDKVSLGTIAARDCIRVLELSEQVVVALLISGRQAMALRLALDSRLRLSDSLQSMLDELSAKILFIQEDRSLESELRDLLTLLNARYWRLYV